MTQTFPISISMKMPYAHDWENHIPMAKTSPTRWPNNPLNEDAPPEELIKKSESVSINKAQAKILALVRAAGRPGADSVFPPSLD